MHLGGHSHGGHGSQGGAGGHVHHAGCSHGQQHHVEPQQYFKQLKQIKDKNIQFYWMEVLKGNALSKYLQYYGLNFLNGVNAQIIQSVVGMAHMMLTCEWMPLYVRPFVSGMFWPIFLFIFINYKVIEGFGNENNQSQKNLSDQLLDRTYNIYIALLPILFFILVALRTSGKLNTVQNKRRAKKILQVRPYLQNMNLMCRACEMPRAFRTTHCPMCKICVPKFSRHSLVFGVCIGAANQLLSMLFFLSMQVFCLYFLYKFALLHSLFGVITQIMLFILNIIVAWMCFVQFSSFFMLNFKFGLTQFEVQNWMALQYLMKAPMRQFMNSCNTGIIHNLTESIYALFGIPGFQSKLHTNNIDSQQRQNEPLKQQISENNNNLLGFPDIKQGVKYIVNWDKAYIYVIPQMPNNPRRKQIEQIMKTQEPRMIQNFKLMKKFKKQVQQENPELNQFQIQQKAMAKMQQHMMKNPQAASILKPPPQQQKAIQLQMIGHMKMQFKNDPQIFLGFEQIEGKLKSGAIGPDEAGLGMRALQQKIMQKKMSEIMKAQKMQEQSKSLEKKTSNEQKNHQILTSNQSSIQAQILQKLQQRSKQMSKQEEKTQEGNKLKNVQKQQQSDKLKQQVVDDENL